MTASVQTFSNPDLINVGVIWAKDAEESARDPRASYYNQLGFVSASLGPHTIKITCKGCNIAEKISKIARSTTLFLLVLNDGLKSTRYFTYPNPSITVVDGAITIPLDQLGRKPDSEPYWTVLNYPPMDY